MVVVGNGLLARAFSAFAHDDSLIIFASGVSNSGQTEETEFERERALLRSFAGTHARLVYFSTIGVFDGSLQRSQYIIHKREMEAAVSTFPAHSVFRLPNLVGHTPNPHTLTNHIFNKIVNGEKLHVFTRARRHLLDVQHASTLCSRMLANGVADNQFLNVHVDRAIDIVALVKIFERVLKREARVELIDKGDACRADAAICAHFMRSIGFEVGDDYNERLIERYYGARVGARD